MASGVVRCRRTGRCGILNGILFGAGRLKATKGKGKDGDENKGFRKNYLHVVRLIFR